MVDQGGSKNSFDYSDRAAQTFTNPLRERGVATEPPPVLSFSATCSQWEMYDSYLDHYRREIVDADSSKVHSPILLISSNLSAPAGFTSKKRAKYTEDSVSCGVVCT